MCRDEVLLYGETFAEVRSDRRFDNFARRLRHQSAHAGELADLLFRSARARVRHQQDGIETVAGFLSTFHLVEHHVGNLFGDIRPNGDDFVVTLAVGDRAIEVLLLHLDDFFFRVFHELVLVARNEHVVDANGDTRLGGIREAERFQMV